ncbi:MAG: hypothetical protein SFX72_01295 [Isosphaeraceae bacterium]|nr:hypothetical protein [Isosphaeraceae bacterium]
MIRKTVWSSTGTIDSLDGWNRIAGVFGRGTYQVEPNKNDQRELAPRARDAAWTSEACRGRTAGA